MEKHNHNNNGGFILGILVGVGITLLFTTKKGRKILKTLSEEGVDKLSKWEDLMRDMQESVDEEIVEGDDYIPASKPIEYEEKQMKEDTQDPAKESIGHNNKHQKDERQGNHIEGILDSTTQETAESPTHVEPKTTRRFFRRVHR